MRYIIDRKTNEHERYDGQNYDATKYRIVEADSDGWIKHEGKVCPLPSDVWCEIKCVDNSQSEIPLMAKSWRWNGLGLTHYRPILADKVQEPVTDAARKERAAELSQIELAGKRMMLLDRLKSAHEHAQTIPDLEAELREVLAGMGYDLVARSPFVEAEDYAAAIAEREPAVETPQDFSAVVAADGLDDWRNWREGDVIEVVGAVASYGRRFYPVGAIRTVVTDNDGDFGVGDTAGDVLTFGRLGHKKFKPECFRFHSRPAKGEK